MLIKNLIVIIILIVIFALAIGYIIKTKKSGAKCIGCPSGGCCSNDKASSCNCNCQSENE